MDLRNIWTLSLVPTPESIILVSWEDGDIQEWPNVTKLEKNMAMVITSQESYFEEDL